jgi:hypothetical protein
MIGFIDTSSSSFFFFLQSLLITINYNGSLLVTAIPYWTASVFPSTVTDLVLIYKSITSSTNDKWRITYEQLTTAFSLHHDWLLFYETMMTASSNYMSSLYNSGANRIEITVSNSSHYCMLICCSRNAC